MAIGLRMSRHVWLSATLILSATATWAQDDKTPRPHAAPVTQTKDAAGTSAEDDSRDTVDSYQPKGVEVGQFLLLPKMEIDSAYNTNVFATTNNAKSDFIGRIAPEALLRSRFSKHELNFTAKLEQFLHGRYKSDDHFDYNFGANGRLDVDKNNEVTGYLNGSQQAEDRGSPDAANGKNPTETHSIRGGVAGKSQMGRYKVSSNLDVSRLEFSDVQTASGTTVRNSLRNRDEVQAVVRGAYEVFPGYDAVLVGTGNVRNYDSAADTNGFNRTGGGYRVETGVAVDISQLLRGDFVVGYMAQDYVDRRLSSVGGLSFRANFNWTPSKMTLIGPYFERTVSETISANVSGLNETVVGFSVRHELQRNILLFGTFSAIFDDYTGTAQTARAFNVKGRVTYILTRELYVAAEAEYRTRAYKLTTLPDYDQFVGALRLGVRL